MRRKFFSIVLVLILLMGATACGRDLYVYDNPCFRTECRDSGRRTRQFFTDNETERFFCQRCVDNCFFCSQSAVRHFTNMMDSLTFVCQDCYDERF